MYVIKVFHRCDYCFRFIFMGNGGTDTDGNTNRLPGGTALKLDKDVEFKVSGLDLTPYLSGPLQEYCGINGSESRGQYNCRPIFNLYGCVCHFGSVHGGHYTAYSKHLTTGQWNYFDDSTVTEKKVPGFEGGASGDYSSAYILFYQRSGSSNTISSPISQHPILSFGGTTIEREAASHSRILEDSGSLLDCRLISDQTSTLRTPFQRKSRNSSDENPTLQSLDNRVTTTDSCSKIISELLQSNTNYDVQKDKPRSMDDMHSLIEREEDQPDLSEIIRSLDTPPPPH